MNFYINERVIYRRETSSRGDVGGAAIQLAVDGLHCRRDVAELHQPIGVGIAV